MSRKDSAIDPSPWEETVTMDVPEDVAEAARARAEEWEDLEPYLLDYVTFEFEWRLPDDAD